MNSTLHFGLCVAICVAGFAAATLLLLNASPLAIGLLLVAAYALAGIGHYALLSTVANRDEWLYVAMAAIWPLVDLWILAIGVLPAADADAPPPIEERA